MYVPTNKLIEQTFVDRLAFINISFSLQKIKALQWITKQHTRFRRSWLPSRRWSEHWSYLRYCSEFLLNSEVKNKKYDMLRITLYHNLNWKVLESYIQPVSFKIAINRIKWYTCNLYNYYNKLFDYKYSYDCHKNPFMCEEYIVDSEHSTFFIEPFDIRYRKLV